MRLPAPKNMANTVKDRSILFFSPSIRGFYHRNAGSVAAVMTLFISMMMAVVPFLSFMVVALMLPIVVMACGVLIVFEDAVGKGLCRSVRVP